MNRKDEERWKNLIIYGIHATDKEMEENAPVMGVIIIVLVVAFIVYCILK